MDTNKINELKSSLAKLCLDFKGNLVFQNQEIKVEADFNYPIHRSDMFYPNSVKMNITLFSQENQRNTDIANYYIYPLKLPRNPQVASIIIKNTDGFRGLRVSENDTVFIPSNLKQKGDYESMINSLPNPPKIVYVDAGVAAP